VQHRGLKAEASGLAHREAVERRRARFLRPWSHYLPRSEQREGREGSLPARRTARQ